MTDNKAQNCSKKTFEEFDKDHKGYILAKDLPALLKRCCDEKDKECSQEDVNKYVARFHPDKDGRISREYFVKTIDEVKK